MCVAICAPYIYLNYLEVKRIDFYLGAQDCSCFEEGAYTGEVSAKMLNEVGVNFCIVGHSERRQYFNESNEIVKLKAVRLIENNIIPIICIGETLDEKNNNKTQNVPAFQLEESVPESSNHFNTIIAYEPIWAIGTGKTPSLEEIENAHGYIKNLSEKLFNFKIIYGGSVNSKNSKLISKIDIVNGALIGGASLQINEFKQIIN
jgi:triosephosphate isomerase